jgi:hypothetical protein
MRGWCYDINVRAHQLHTFPNFSLRTRPKASSLIFSALELVISPLFLLYLEALPYRFPLFRRH